MALGDKVKVEELGGESDEFKVLYEVEKDVGQPDDLILDFGKVHLDSITDPEKEPFITPDLNALKKETNINGREEGHLLGTEGTWQ